jgi:hypothetical protein
MDKSQYLTWYEFKKELQKKLGRCVLTQEWLHVKPRMPLPWDKSCMALVFSRCSNLKLNNKS